MNCVAEARGDDLEDARALRATTSGPMPSPGSKTIVAFIAISFRVPRASQSPYSMPSASATSDASRMLGDAPTVVQRACVAVGAVIDEHARDRGRAVAAVEDAHLVVLEVDARRPAGYAGASALRSAASSALTGPLPSAAVWTTLAADANLDRRLGERLVAVALADSTL